MHPRDELPPPVRPAIVRPSLLHGVGNVLAGMALLYAVVFLLRWWMQPLPLPATASSTSGPPASPVSFPPELLQMAVAVSTSLAPTPTPTPTPIPTPTYSMLPTPPAISVCLTSTPKGEVCSQPKLPLPSPTPMADCPVLPGELCVWRGGVVTWLNPTSTPASSTNLNP